MNLEYKKTLLACTVGALALSACGGSDPATVNGVFLDSAVGGLGYSAGSTQASTDANGGFTCRENETVSFSLGDIALGSARCGATLTPLDLAGSTEVSDDRVVNRLLLLQSLDDDGDPSNGIALRADVVAAFKGKTLDLALGADEFGTALAALLPALADANGAPFNTRALDTTQRKLAREHFENTLASKIGKGVTSTVTDATAGAVQLTKYIVQSPAGLYVPYDGSNAAVAADFPIGFYPAAGSGLAFKGKAADGTLEFYGITDRGPNGDGPTAPTPADPAKTGISKVFPAPKFNPSIGVFTVDKKGAALTTLTPLSVSDALKATGLPPQNGVGSTGETPLTEALVYDAARAPFDVNGLDPESIVIDSARQALWISDEYGPFIAKLDPATLRVLKKYQPGTTAGDLPAVLAKRRVNRGMEGLTLDAVSGKLHGFLQSPIDDGKAIPAGGSAAVNIRHIAKFVRWIEFDPTAETSRLYALPIDGTQYKDGRSGNAKLGDVVALGGGKFLVIEQGAGVDGKIFNHLMLVRVPADATDIAALGSDLEKSSITGAPVNAADYSKLVVLQKTRLFDLNAAGWVAEKAEGLALIDDSTIALMNDNDFGLRSILVDANGKEVAGSIEDCAVDANGSIVSGCPAGVVGARVARGKPAERPVRLWLMKFPKKLADYAIGG